MAQAHGLDRGPVKLEACIKRGIRQRIADPLRRGFGHTVAACADQEGRAMVLRGMRAGGKGIKTPDAMGQPVLDQKIQRAIRHRGLRAIAFGSKLAQHVISPKRPMRLQQNFQRAAPYRRQAQPARPRPCFRLGEYALRIGDAAVIRAAKTGPFCVFRHEPALTVMI